jgi:dihydroflavonol-4-reductase
MALRKRQVDVVHADLDEPESLAAAMANTDLVLHVAGHYPALSLDPEATLALGLRQMLNVLDAAALQGVRRLVYVSSAATAAPSESDEPSTEAHVFADADGMGAYHTLKFRMEQLALAEDRLEVTIACPGACLGPWDQRVGTSAPLVALANGQPVALPDGMLNLVDVRDAAAGIAELGLLSTVPERVLMVGHNLPLFDFLNDVADRYGVPGPKRLPAMAARRAALREERIAARDGTRAKLSVELVDLIVEGIAIDASLSRQALGLTYRPVEETLEAFEQWARPRRILPRILENSP